MQQQIKFVLEYFPCNGTVGCEIALFMTRDRQPRRYLIKVIQVGGWGLEVRTT